MFSKITTSAIVFTSLLFSTFFFGAPALAGEPQITSEHNQLVAKIKKKKLKLTRFDKSAELKFTVEGPATVEIILHQVRKPKDRKESSQALVINRDGTHELLWLFTLPKGHVRGKILKPRKAGKLSPAVTGHLKVPEGHHTYTLTLDSGVTLGVLVKDSPSFDEALALGPEEALEGVVAETDEEAITEAASELAAAGATEAVGAESRSASLGITDGDEAATAEFEGVKAEESGSSDKLAEVKETGEFENVKAGDDAEIEEVAADTEENVEATGPGGDDSVSNATTALATTISTQFAQKMGDVAFHRVAIPYFQELGDGVSEHHLGQLIAELLASELSMHKPFILVERERLDQIMREHRLKDLGIIDESSAAQFGKVLGAQSLISGTVAEVGPNYIVTVRQVDAESGKVLVASKISFNKGNLVALSADAVVLRTKTGAMMRSGLVPGWGQFYNKEPTKAAGFLVAGLGTLGTAMGFYAAGLSAQSEYQENTVGVIDSRDVANSRFKVTNALLWGYAAVWAINMADAYFNGSDSTSIELPSPKSAEAAL